MSGMYSNHFNFELFLEISDGKTKGRILSGKRWNGYESVDFHEINFPGVGVDPDVGYCENGNEPDSPTKGRKFIIS
jgi:hypothetical protein